MAGPSRVVRLLQDDGRYALIENGEGAAKRLRIFHLESRESCELPADSFVPGSGWPHTAPNLRGADARVFLMPLFRVEGERQVLWFTDEKCGLRGPFADATEYYFTRINLRSDGRNVSLVIDAAMTLRLVDPWSGQVLKVADNVEPTGVPFRVVLRNDASSMPEAVWVREQGKLNMRAYDGTLLLSLGSAVTSFDQTLRDALRVAFRDNGDMYEAKGPGFAPVLIAEKACGPSYGDNALDIWLPCAQRQLVRVDLTSGAVRRFEPKVFKSTTAGDITFEEARENPENPDEISFYAYSGEGTRRMSPRVKLTPTPDNAIAVIAGQRVVARTITGELGIYALDTGFTAGYRNITYIRSFRDARTGQLLWLIAYDVGPDRIGKLGVVEQRQLERVVERARVQGDAGLQADAGALPLSDMPLPISDTTHIDRYNVYFPAGVHDPVVLTLEPPIVPIAENVFSGTLHAYLLSGDKHSEIDEGVESFDIIVAPFPGILYGIMQGPRSGLWFAAL